MMADAVNGFRLSPGQQRLWSQMMQGTVPRDLRVCARFAWTGTPPAPAAIAAALDRLVRRYEILRTRFLSLPEMRLPLQAACDPPPFALAQGPVPADPDAPGLHAWMEGETLVLSLSALCADGPTLLHLGSALAGLLAGNGDGAGAEEEPLQFFDLAQWQHDLLAEEGGGDSTWPAGDLWAVDTAPPTLPALRAAAPGPFRPTRQPCPLPPGTDARLHACCAALGVEPADLLTGLWAALLWRLSGGMALPVSLVADGRPYDELAGATGPLASVVPLALFAILAAPGTRFSDLVRAVAAARGSASEMCHHLTPPGEELFVPFPVEVLTAPDAPGTLLYPVEVIADTAPYLLKLTALTGPGTLLRLDLDHHGDAVQDGALPFLADQVATLLAAMLDQPDALLGEPDILGPAERQLVTVGFQGRMVPPGPWQPVHLAVAAQALAHPDRACVQDGTLVLTNAVLEARVQALAQRLAQAGVTAESVVALHLPRGADHVVAMLAVLRAGGAYLPLPPDLPAERLHFILGDSGAGTVLTHAALAVNLPDDPALVTILLDTPPGAAAPPLADAFPVPGPGQAAYILYTSGSTGRPKGVVVTHGSLANHMAWMGRAFPLTQDDRVLQKTATGFDASVWEFFLPLMQGARLVMAPTGLERDIPALLRMLVEGGITILQLVPSLLRVLVDQPAFAQTQTLRLIFCGGEALTPSLARRLHAVHGAGLVNLYGPTETTIQICAEPVDPADDPVSIGRPIDNVRLYVVDDHDRPVPVGMRGEILIGGAAPARGYLNRPDLTAERFVPDPVDPAAGRVYRSGDQGAWRFDGRLDFFGRTDHQVKLRGYRVELGEVEAAAGRHGDVAHAIVWVDRDANGIDRLVCAYACRPQRAVEPAALRDWLSGTLADYMVPGLCHRLEALPVNASGKIDRAAVAAHVASISSAETGDGLAPRDPVELRLERVWETVLDIHPVGVDRSFFDLGGHSLLAVRLMAEVKLEFGCDLPLVSLFQAPTVAAQADLIRRQVSADPVMVPINRGLEGERPVFLVHPTGGSVLCYRDLARRLGTTRPVYALQDPGLEGSADYTSVEELAALYIARIRPLATGGPYYLAGWSSGGVIAFEMARQLLARGEEVGLLAMIDSVAASGPEPEPRPDTDLIGAVARLLAFEAGLDMPDLSGLDADAGMGRLHELAVTAGILPPDAPATRIHRLFAVFRRNADVIRRYRPGAYPRRVLLLRATTPLPDAVRDAAAMQRSDDPDLGWGAVAMVSRRDIPAHHLSIVQEPAAALVGAEMRHALLEADRLQQMSERVFFTLLGQ
ncbi:non-ribosomal peptide synthetase [Niveispirillum irakense]|uniref:non-ribosomal peptide synthetase n=1 Tax=Niveispirillum irakense TaxID=34011 RepID=UPI000405BF31|nr:non-ribosomal peptide synthetase [Niveispirillum irakense]